MSGLCIQTKSASQAHESDIEPLGMTEIVGSISRTSNALNTFATLLIADPVRKSGVRRPVCVPAITARPVIMHIPQKTTEEWNFIALSHPQPREPLTKTNGLRAAADYLVVIALPLLLILMEAWIVGRKGTAQFQFLIKYAGLSIATGISAFVILFLFREARAESRSTTQRVLLYTAAFLLCYEVWILFSIVLAAR